MLNVAGVLPVVTFTGAKSQSLADALAQIFLSTVDTQLSNLKQTDHFKPYSPGGALAFVP